MKQAAFADAGSAAPADTCSPRPAQAGALLGAQMLFNVGFFAVVPFLAGVLREDFLLAGTAVGLVLGIRTAAQQGLFLVGGTLADRFGGRTLILVGCAVRVSGFATLAWSTADFARDLPLGMRLGLFVTGTVLTGLGGALFSPALETLVARADVARAGAHRSGDVRAGRDRPRTSLFALLAVFGEVGAAIGPVAGAALLGWGFAAVAASGAGLFIAIAATLALLLPRNPARTGTARQRLHRPWRVLRDRRFVALAVLASVNLLAYNQLYLGLPVELTRAGGGDSELALLFVVVSVLTIALQVPLSRYVLRRPPAGMLRLGYLLLSAAFAVLVVGAPLPVPAGWAALTPAVAATVLLTLGHLVLGPLVLSLVPRFAPEESLGSYYGLLATCGGASVLLGNVVLGALYPAAQTPSLSAAAPWTVLAILPVLSAVLVPRLLPSPV